MRNRFYIILLCLLFPVLVAGQDLYSTISKVRPACVRMWGFDTVQQQRTSAQFSGVVVKGKYVLTAAHVTIPGNTYKVFFTDGREAIAKALGKIELADDKTRPDVAMMMIVKGTDWPSAEMSESKLNDNEPCLSIAYPESLNQTQPTVRLGKVTEPLNSRGFIRSTALMEPGDSGGPLFNIRGELIGLHSAIEIPEAANYDVPVDLYQKYWLALQDPVVYHNWPEKSTFIAGKTRLSTFSWPKAGNYTGAYVKMTSFYKGQAQNVLGTVVSSLVVSKSSLVGDSVIIMGKLATVIARDKTNDLVLLRPVQKLKGISINPVTPQVGDFLFAPVEDSVVAGIISGGQLDLAKVSGGGFLGATPAHGSSPARVYFVRPGSPAAQHDIRVGDILDGYADAAAFNAMIANLWPGDTVSVQLKRGAEILKKTIVLTYPPQIVYDHPADHFAGGKSLRRDGFKEVYTSDLVLKPEQCGGPVFDAKNHFCGIVIARFSRANSIILTAETIRKFIETNYLKK
ncbi:trypsin-like peptidase domain-containing protein [Mucilaginibacter ximonensis]|uniref:Trypsin-like peptidase domain-containing protein n=1 Tax=Mucilaginibacter ximonensis TaxID=538021 RepID=A0ABW5YFT7_9SPHI